MFLEKDSKQAADVFRPCDWALCRTTLGTMVEPHTMFSRKSTDTPTANYDYSDEMCRVDDIIHVSVDTLGRILSAGNDIFHGGVLIPKTGR